MFGSGYLTNLGVIPALVGRADLVLLDELCHSCLLAGAELSRARVLEFRHNDIEPRRRRCCAASGRATATASC